MITLFLALLARLAPFAMREVRIPSVRRDNRGPVVIGHRRGGRPIYAMGGADDTTTTTLEQERDALLARLANPEAGDDVAALATQATELAERITAHNGQVAAAEAARAALTGATVTRTTPTAPAAPAAQRQPSGDPSDPREDRAMVTEVRESLGAVYQRMLTEGGDQSPLARYRERGSGALRIDVPGMTSRSLFDTANNVTNFPRVPGMVQLQDQALQILDLIDRQNMTSTSIEWVQETTAPNAAAEVAHGAAKPETTFVLTLKTDTAATIAHWVNITRQALDDDTMIRGYVEGRLGYGLLKRLNGQILNGNGTAPNLRGILNTSGIGTYTPGGATEAAILSIRKAKTVAQLSEYEPDAVVMNPVDWETVELSADTTGQWRLATSAAAGAPMRVWGLAVVSTTAILGTSFGVTGGTFLVGAFRVGATLWERTGIQLFITDSHASNFTSNILTLLAELRAALTVWRPLAFVKGTFGASRT